MKIIYANKTRADERGFSIIELMIAMTVTLVVMGIVVSVLAGAFNIRNRENQRSSGGADAQRALNIMSREIATAGYGLSDNGIVTGDSGVSQIRVRSDLNLSGATTEAGEDVMYTLDNDANGSFIVRTDLQPTQSSNLLANRIDGLKIHYYDQKVTYTISNGDISNVLNSSGTAQAEVTPDLAKYLVIVVSVTLPPVGKAGTNGYQPASSVQLVSDVVLRNANLAKY